MPILLDVESRSRADLTVVGGRNYWEHESTRALCVVLHDTRDGERMAWTPGDEPPVLEGRDLGAHNWSGFDRFAMARLGWRGLDYMDGIDTSEAARMAGLPGALDALAKRWLGRAKDKVASEYTKRLSQCRRPAGRKVGKGAAATWSADRISPEDWRELSADEKRLVGIQPTVTGDVLEYVVRYCDSDVDVIADGWPLLEPYLDYEPDVRLVDRLVNDRGVAFDVQLAARLLEEDARNAGAACRDAARALGAEWTETRVREVAGSPEQFADVTGLPDATKATLDAAWSPDGKWTPLIEARRALASIARGKLEAGLARVSPDGRLRDSHRYVGAHPWRWAGKGLQTQNIPRPEKRFEDWGDAEICAAADAVLAGGRADPGLIDVLLRASLHARAGCTLAVQDFSGVEARGLAWLADDQDRINVLLSKVGPYRTMAGVIYGRDPAEIGKGDPAYTIGKISELACQYQGARGAFAKMAKTQGVDLSNVDVDEVVAAWRRANPKIVQFWYALERAFVRAAQGTEARLGRLTLAPSDDGKDVAVFLPNDRPIVYNDARLRRDERGRVKVSYAPMGFGPGTYVNEDGELRADTYGGKLTQNVIEGVCRELLAGALVGAELAGLAPVLHVHDEIAAEVPANAGEEGLAELSRIMLTLPDWASEFPIGAAGHTGTRYRK